MEGEGGPSSFFEHFLKAFYGFVLKANEHWRKTQIQNQFVVDNASPKRPLSINQAENQLKSRSYSIQPTLVTQILAIKNQGSCHSSATGGGSASARPVTGVILVMDAILRNSR